MQLERCAKPYTIETTSDVTETLSHSVAAMR
jgi:hypothetical protein